jgi:hypothetical protein
VRRRCRPLRGLRRDSPPASSTGPIADPGLTPGATDLRPLRGLRTPPGGWGGTLISPRAHARGYGLAPPSGAPNAARRVGRNGGLSPGLRPGLLTFAAARLSRAAAARGIAVGAAEASERASCAGAVAPFGGSGRAGGQGARAARASSSGSRPGLLTFAAARLSCAAAPRGIAVGAAEASERASCAGAVAPFGGSGGAGRGLEQKTHRGPRADARGYGLAPPSGAPNAARRVGRNAGLSPGLRPGLLTFAAARLSCAAAPRGIAVGAAETSERAACAGAVAPFGGSGAIGRGLRVQGLSRTPG